MTICPYFVTEWKLADSFAEPAQMDHDQGRDRCWRVSIEASLFQ